MLKNNAINILGVFAVLALSLLFLARAAKPTTAKAERTAAAAHPGAPAGSVVIQALPPDAVIIRALPADD